MINIKNIPNLKRKELQSLCKEYGLKAGGKNVELQKRLIEYLQENINNNEENEENEEINMNNQKEQNFEDKNNFNFQSIINSNNWKDIVNNDMNCYYLDDNEKLFGKILRINKTSVRIIFNNNDEKTIKCNDKNLFIDYHEINEEDDNINNIKNNEKEIVEEVVDVNDEDLMIQEDNDEENENNNENEMNMSTRQIKIEEINVIIENTINELTDTLTPKKKKQDNHNNNKNDENKKTFSTSSRPRPRMNRSAQLRAKFNQSKYSKEQRLSLSSQKKPFNTRFKTSSIKKTKIIIKPKNEKKIKTTLLNNKKNIKNKSNDLCPDFNAIHSNSFKSQKTIKDAMSPRFKSKSKSRINIKKNESNDSFQIGKNNDENEKPRNNNIKNTQINKNKRRNNFMKKKKEKREKDIKKRRLSKHDIKESIRRKSIVGIINH